jgi:lycopene cyclase domain-containing protein
MNLYLLINIAIISVPLALSFDRRVRFYRSWLSVFGSILIVGAIYVVWDMWMAHRGDWGFNERFAGTANIGGLPTGELLFFITVPYSCLFIFEVVREYFKERRYSIPRVVWYFLSGVLLVAAILFRKQNYTFTVLLSAAAFFLITTAFFNEILSSRSFWLFMAISFVPFLLFNGLLTALPVVVYSRSAIWGIRIITIPLEDFFYSFSLLGFSVLVFRTIKKLAGRQPTRQQDVQPS